MSKKNISSVGMKCVGCRACELSCPQSCIEMKMNEEGFLYPVIDEEKCTECGLCVNKCAQAHKREQQRKPLVVYALKNKDHESIMKSASGGASDVIAKAILDRGGCVYGAAYTDEFYVQHVEVCEDKDRQKIQSSKYVQSDLLDCYKKAKEKLERGIIILFTGTPCQIDGLYHYLGREYDNLYTIDLICHGVPSPIFFQKYIEYMSKKMKGKVIYYNFRSKEKRGWGTQYVAKTKTKTKTKTLVLDKYGKSFMSGNCYRESCYCCEYANLNRPADITVGDFWGIEKCHPDFFSEKGVSVVLVNSEKGSILIDWIHEGIEAISCSLDDVIKKQGNLIRSTERTRSRDMFYHEFTDENYVDKIKVGLQLKERLKRVLPSSFVVKIKQKL